MKTKVQQASDALDEVEKFCTTEATQTIAAEEIISACERIKQRLTQRELNNTVTISPE